MLEVWWRVIAFDWRWRKNTEHDMRQSHRVYGASPVKPLATDSGTYPTAHEKVKILEALSAEAESMLADSGRREVGRILDRGAPE